MAVADLINEHLETDTFANYEHEVYSRYQERAELEIVEKLNGLLANPAFITILKLWAAKCACKFDGYRDIKIRLKSGKRWEVSSPIFLKAKPKKKEVGNLNVKKDDCGILALNYLASLKR